jgi:hypothetical protein
MDDIGFILTCYIASFAAVGVVARWALRRGRDLSAQVPDEDKPWI